MLMLVFSISNLEDSRSYHFGEYKVSAFAKLPKKDRIDLAIQQEFDMTKDPQLGMVPYQRLHSANKYIEKLMLSKGEDKNLGLSWTERGPNNVGGRSRAIVFDRSDNTGNKALAGSVSGGLWKTSNFTSPNVSWTNLNSNLNNLSITALAQAPNVTNTYYAGTGEGFFGSTGIRGNGIYKSINGGNSWSQLSSTNSATFNFVQKIVVTDNGYIFACTFHGGVQLSKDGGSSWYKSLGDGKYGATNRAADIEIAKDGTLFASLGILNADGIYKSEDNGSTWKKLSSGLPGSGYERIEIATAPSDKNVIYIALQDATTEDCKGIYKSEDKGESWTPCNNPRAFAMNNFARSQAWYSLALVVDLENKNTLYLGGVDMLQSKDGGLSWNQLTQWEGKGGYPYMHADQHYFLFHPNNKNLLAVGNDGGIWLSKNTQNLVPSFSHKSAGFNVTQFYSVAIHPDNGRDYFLAGSQDNGTQRFNNSGMNSTDEVAGGDGGFCHINATTPSNQIASHTFNLYQLSTDGGNSFSLKNFGFVGKFINATDFDNTTQKLYAGYGSSKILRWDNPATGGNSYSIITLTGMKGEPSSITVSPNVENRIYVGTDRGYMYRIDDAHQGTYKLAEEIRAGNEEWLSSISIEKGQENHIIFTYSNYGVQSVLESSNGGSTWTNVEGNLPDMPIRWVEFVPGSSSKAIVATELGVWSTDQLNAGQTKWDPEYQGMEKVRVDMLQIRSGDGLLAAASHGRGLFTAKLSSDSGGGSEPTGGAVSVSLVKDTYVEQEFSNAELSGSCLVPSRTINIPIVISQKPTISTTVNISVGSGTMTNYADFSLLQNKVTFSPSSSNLSKSFQVTLYDDAISEGNENIELKLTSSNATIVGSSIVNITLTDDDQAPGSSATANIITVGNGATKFSHGPFKAYYEDAKSQILFKASELKEAGVTPGRISSLSWNVLEKKSGIAFRNFTISLKNTNQSSIVKGSSFSTGLTTVYRATISTKSGWNEFVFDSPFEWNGKDNLLIQACFDNSSWSVDDVVEVHNASFDAQGYSYQDNTSGCSISTVGNVTSLRPNLGFGQNSSMAVATSKANRNSLLPKYKENHYFDSEHRIIGSLRNNGNSDISCSSVEIDRVGSGSYNANWLEGYEISDKNFYVDIGQNRNCEMILYFDKSEVLDLGNPSDLKILRSDKKISSTSTFTSSEIIDPKEMTLINGDIYAFKFDIKKSSGVALAKPAGILPVVIKDFSLRQKGNGILLNWEVYDEIDVEAYAIERSSDGQDFSEIGIVPAMNLEVLHDYFYLDLPHELQGNLLYYRLRVKEYDGSSWYSKIVNIIYTNDPSIIANILPNPSLIGESVEVISEMSFRQYYVFDGHGKLIISDESTELKNHEIIRSSGLIPGVYYIKLVGDYDQKVIKWLICH